MLPTCACVRVGKQVAGEVARIVEKPLAEMGLYEIVSMKPDLRVPARARGV